MTELLAEAQPNLQFCTRLRRRRAGCRRDLHRGGNAAFARRQPGSAVSVCRPREASASTTTAIYGGGEQIHGADRQRQLGRIPWFANPYEQHHGKKANGQFSVASNPEFLREGTALHDSLYPDRVVIGSDDAALARNAVLAVSPYSRSDLRAATYLPRPEGMGAVPLISTDLASAELIKYAANAFLALKISYINEIGQLAEKVGADIQQVAKGIGLDARIGTRFLQAGIGWGGSCFGKDTSALVATAAEYNLTMPIVEAAREINRRQRERVVDKLLGELKILKGRTIGLLGLAFKPNTDDLREAPAIDIARKLVERGCKVKVHDPVAHGALSGSNIADLA